MKYSLTGIVRRIWPAKPKPTPAQMTVVALMEERRFRLTCENGDVDLCFVNCAHTLHLGRGDQVELEFIAKGAPQR